MDEIEAIQVLRSGLRERPLSIGFTGTRQGMTTHQKAMVQTIVGGLSARQEDVTWHDGDCVGSDDQAHRIVEFIVSAGMPIWTVGHPSNLNNYRAWNVFDEMRKAKPPLVRNMDMVDDADVMLATPFEAEEQKRGGTWSTVRYTNKKHTPLFLIRPDGTVQVCNVYS